MWRTLSKLRALCCYSHPSECADYPSFHCQSGPSWTVLECRSGQKCCWYRTPSKAEHQCWGSVRPVDSARNAMVSASPTSSRSSNLGLLTDGHHHAQWIEHMRWNWQFQSMCSLVIQNLWSSTWSTPCSVWCSNACHKFRRSPCLKQAEIVTDLSGEIGSEWWLHWARGSFWVLYRSSWSKWHPLYCLYLTELPALRSTSLQWCHLMR